MSDPPINSDRLAVGMATRRSVLGDAHVDRAEAASTPFDAARPAWKDLHMVPRFCCMPEACVAAIPAAWVV